MDRKTDSQDDEKRAMGASGSFPAIGGPSAQAQKVFSKIFGTQKPKPENSNRRLAVLMRMVKRALASAKGEEEGR